MQHVKNSNEDTQQLILQVQTVSLIIMGVIYCGFGVSQGAILFRRRHSVNRSKLTENSSHSNYDMAAILRMFCFH